MNANHDWSDHHTNLSFAAFFGTCLALYPVWTIMVTLNLQKFPLHPLHEQRTGLSSKYVLKSFSQYTFSDVQHNQEFFTRITANGFVIRSSSQSVKFWTQALNKELKPVVAEKQRKWKSTRIKNGSIFSEISDKQYYDLVHKTPPIFHWSALVFLHGFWLGPGQKKELCSFGGKNFNVEEIQ